MPLREGLLAILDKPARRVAEFDVIDAVLRDNIEGGRISIGRNAPNLLDERSRNVLVRELGMVGHMSNDTEWNCGNKGFLAE